MIITIIMVVVWVVFAAAGGGSKNPCLWKFNYDNPSERDHHLVMTCTVVAEHKIAQAEAAKAAVITSDVHMLAVYNSEVRTTTQVSKVRKPSKAEFNMIVGKEEHKKKVMGKQNKEDMKEYDCYIIQGVTLMTDVLVLF